MNLQPSPENTVDHLRRAETIHNFHSRIKDVFPQFTDVDTRRFLDYDKSKDSPRHGRVLSIFTEAGREGDVSNMMISFKPEGIILTMVNTPNTESKHTFKRKGCGTSGPGIGGSPPRLWRENELDLMLDVAKLRTEGVSPESEELRAQYVGYNTETGGFYTLGEIMDYNMQVHEQNRKKMTPNQRTLDFFGNMQGVLPDAYALTSDKGLKEKAKALAMARVRQRGEYKTLEGTPMEVDEVCAEILKESPFGIKATLREANLVEQQIEFLRQGGYIL